MKVQPAQWWYLSFCDNSRPKGSHFLGACLVWAHGMTSAIQRAHELGCYPGGEVLAIPVGEVQPIPANRLLSREELGPGKTGRDDNKGPKMKEALKVLWFVQVVLGLFKIYWAFTPYGTPRRTWHFVSGLVIVVAGVLLLTDTVYIK